MLDYIEKRQVDIEKRQVGIEDRLELIQRALGRIELRQLRHNTSDNLLDYEYQVFSQWGEDGIIQFLINNVEIENKIFVEFGVEDYLQANTRFLLVNNNWAGLVIDGSDAHISRIKSAHFYWNYNLKAIKSFVTKDNINNLLLEQGIAGEIGLLSIDIDGNDYWVWEAINVIHPVIVIVEYNYRLGSQAAVTIPYSEDFDRAKTHHSMIYFGASLKALCLLAKRKGYVFVGCCSNGVNAFFIRADKKPSSVREMTPEEGYKSGQFCETRNQSGEQIKTSPKDEVLLLTSLNLPLVNVEE
ncbi:NADH dehydrogenase [Scytonema hofmannii PCC 7110]|uniref:NADH dehydrogenase n=2 Tax=Scytonema hofmannii TaxID=34078 RepID=A0A139X4E0_9CYAN|nr:NADH dehydrogenase [Scytonema hofmannii PCC 7110]